jgi:YD repeat-containing protein
MVRVRRSSRGISSGRKLVKCTALAFTLATGALSLLSRQSVAQTDPPQTIGMAPFGSYHGSDIDSVDLTNGNLTVIAPLISYPQRGGKLTLNFDIVYNAKSWHWKTVCPHSCYQESYFQGNGVEVSDTQSMGLSNSATYQPYGTSYTWGVSTSVKDFSGSSHVMGGTNLQVYNNGSATYLYYASGLSLDGSGIAMTQNYESGAYQLIDRDGIRYYTPPAIGASGVVREDSNGNQIIQSQSGYTLTDTLGRNINIVGVSSTDATGCTGSQPITGVAIASLPGPTGSTASVYKYCYVTLTPYPNFTCYHCITNSNTQSQQFLQSIVLPSGAAWTFEYQDRDPSDSSSINYGDLTEIVLPTGGSISYKWVTGGNIGGNDQQRWVASRTVNDNTGSHTWTYTYGATYGTPTTVTSPPDANGVSSDTVYTFGLVFANTLGFSNEYEVQRQYYMGSHTSGSLLSTVNTGYQDIFIPWNPWLNTSSDFPSCVLPVTKQTVWPNGQTSEGDTSYDSFTFTWDYYVENGVGNPSTYNCSYGNPTQINTYDYGSGSHGALLRQETMLYKWQNTPTYAANNLISLVATDSVYSGGGTLAAETTYGYDEYSLNPSGVTTQHDQSPPDGSLRGNQTSLHRWLSGQTVATANCNVSVSNGWLVSTNHYLDTGMVNTKTDPCSYLDMFQYSANYAGSYLTTHTNALNQVWSYGYDSNSGLRTSTTDPNLDPTGYSYDSMLRLTGIQYPDQGSTTGCYSDMGGATCTQSGPPYQVVKTQAISSSPVVTKTTTTTYDVLGRVSQTQLNSDPSGTDYSLTAYDGLGRKLVVYNPTRCSSITSNCDGEMTWGYSTTNHDPINRITSVVEQDGSTVSTVYGTAPPSGFTGYCITVTDEANNSRQSCVDGLGRVTSVVEDPGSSPHLNYLTTYGYDPLNNLLSVTQGGGATGSGGAVRRSFTYDSLSRMVCASNPENSTAACPSTLPSSPVSGTVGYVYDSDGNVLTKTDARSVVTNYSYDALNRLLSKTYTSAPPGTMASCYQYDTAVNGIGRLGAEWTQPGSCSSTPPPAPPAINQSLRVYAAYDPMGRVQAEQQCAAGYCTSTSPPSAHSTPCTALSSAIGLQYCYDLLGNLLAYSNGVTTAAAGQYPQHALLFAQTFDAVGRLASVGVGSSSSDGTHPQSLFSAATYTPFNALSNWLLGTQLSTTRTYDSRLRVTGQSSAP